LAKFHTSPPFDRAALRRLAAVSARLTGMPRSEIVRRGLTRISGTAHDLIG